MYTRIVSHEKLFNQHSLIISIDPLSPTVTMLSCAIRTGVLSTLRRWRFQKETENSLSLVSLTIFVRVRYMQSVLPCDCYLSLNLLSNNNKPAIRRGQAAMPSLEMVSSLVKPLCAFVRYSLAHLLSYNIIFAYIIFCSREPQTWQ